MLVAAAVVGLVSSAQAQGLESGGRFVPVPSSEIVNTKTGVGGNTKAFAPNETRTYAALGKAGVPTQNVSAIMVSITALDATVESSMEIASSSATFTDFSVIRIERP